MSRARPGARAVVVVLVALVVAAVVLWSAQRRLTYFPAGTPPPVEQVLPDGREVVLTTDDGLDLRAWWVPEGPTAVMVLPGNGGNRAGRVPLATALRQQLGLSVLLVDYRGYGGNPGTPSQDGLSADARAAAEWLSARDDVDDVVYLGESLGAAVAIGLARERAPAALVLRSPFTSLVDVARTHYGPIPRWLLRDQYPSHQWIGEVTAPLLVVASESDEIVPFALSQRLFEAADDPKQLVTVPDAGHNDRALLDGEAFMDAIESFLDDLGLRPGT